MNTSRPLQGSSRLTAFGLILLAVSIFAVLLYSVPERREPMYEGKSLGLWLDDLRSPSPASFAAATNAIRRMGTNAVPFLITRLQTKESMLRKRVTGVLERQRLVPVQFHHEFQIRDSALRGICLIGADAKAAVPTLVEMLYSDLLTAQRASEALASIGDEAVPALRNCLNSSNTFVRSHAAFILSSLHAETNAVAASMVSLLSHGNIFTRSQAAAMLSRSPEQASTSVPAFIAQLNDPERVMRGNVRRALAKFGPAASAAVPVLLKNLRDQDVSEVIESMQALLEIAPEETLAALIGNMQSSDGLLRQNSAYALRSFREKGTPAIPVLVQCLQDPETKVRQYAALALGDIRAEPEMVVPALMQNMKDPDLHVRTSTALALGKFGERAKAAAPDVRKLIQEHAGDAVYQSWLLQVLEVINPEQAIDNTL